MKIASVAAGSPSKTVTNEDVLDLVARHSGSSLGSDLPRVLKVVERLFHKSGVETRRWFGDDQHPMEVLEDTFGRALARAGIPKESLDLLVCASVTRGFVEPAGSAFMAKALGLKCRNFDVVDACMGWITAMEVVNNRMKAGEIECAAIITLELAMRPGGPVFPKNFALKSVAELEYKYPSLTLGEAVTVTILRNDASGDNFNFRFANHPELSDLCSIPLPGWQWYCDSSNADRIGVQGGDFRFISFGGTMHELGVPLCIDLVRRSGLRPDTVDHVFTHTGSPRQWEHSTRVLGLDKRLHRIGHRTGNVATASVPLAINDAVEQDALKRGETCLALVGSAGMVFCAVTFTF